jgi:hypothetical protein
MGNDVRERFERLEQVVQQIAEAHLDLEAAQKNTAVLLNRFIEESGKRGAKVDERIANLTILVDQLIMRDFNKTAIRPLSSPLASTNLGPSNLTKSTSSGFVRR